MSHLTGHSFIHKCKALGFSRAIPKSKPRAIHSEKLDNKFIQKIYWKIEGERKGKT